MKRWIKITIAVLILLIGLGVILIDVVLEGIVESRLESAIKMDANRLYDYQFESQRRNEVKAFFLSFDYSPSDSQWARIFPGHGSEGRCTADEKYILWRG